MTPDPVPLPLELLTSMVTTEGLAFAATAETAATACGFVIVTVAGPLTEDPAPWVPSQSAQAPDPATLPTRRAPATAAVVISPVRRGRSAARW
ncbi:hypothetical protein [Cnuibacter physcomitrellae]|uniref:hypothetical protein n=1 Tax=Cnuibacter physcomitrellae TaxID=1619308 RepID=UPI0012F516FB|nr:hypothetical protein [Cnuibacter physcomitrellae]